MSELPRPCVGQSVGLTTGSSSKMSLRIRPKCRPQCCKTKKRLNVSKLKNHLNRIALADNLESQLADFHPAGNVEEDWESFRDTVHTTSVQILGYPKRNQPDWFDENDEEIEALLTEKYRLHRVYQNDPTSNSKKNAFTSVRRTVQNKLRTMQDSWLSAKADEIQPYADRKDSKQFYAALNTIYGLRSSGSSPLLSSDGTTLIVEKSKIMERWAEHFEAVLNRPSSINDEAIDRMAQVNINTTMDGPHSELEVQEAISQLSSGKAPGSDAIPSDIYKAGGHIFVQKLTELFKSFSDQGSVPQELNDASIVHLYKRKGNRQSCDNHRGISLLSIAGKLLARVLLNLLKAHLEDGLLPESQCGPWDCRHDLCCPATSRKASRAEPVPLHHICRSYKSFPSGPVEDYVYVWVSRTIHPYGTPLL